MRIGTLATADGARAVALQNGALLELEGTVRELIQAGPASIAQAIERSPRTHPYEPSQLLTPISDPGKVLAIGRNFAAHIEEIKGASMSGKPVIFARFRTSLCAPFAPIYRPRVSVQMDWEAELAVVIGRPGRYIPEHQAMDHVFGYCAFNDISIRDYQDHTPQWTPGKNFDGSGPFGPLIVSKDEVPEPGNLDVSCIVILADGTEEVRQAANTSLLLWSIPQLIAYISEFTTLEPGDVIATGTPAGVGKGRNPQVWLEPGQTMITRVENVGEMRNQVVEERASGA
ncbi:MAG: fumarylacetoacetate hydrolase family protein [Candidatus Dormibacteraceae bacterium]